MSVTPGTEPPGLTADWAAIVAEAEAIGAMTQPYKAADGHMSVAAPSRANVLRLVEHLRHTVRYAADAERGNGELRGRLEEADQIIDKLQAALTDATARLVAAEKDAARGRELFVAWWWAQEDSDDPFDLPELAALVEWTRAQPVEGEPCSTPT